MENRTSSMRLLDIKTLLGVKPVDLMSCCRTRDQCKSSSGTSTRFFPLQWLISAPARVMPPLDVHFTDV